MPLALDQAPAAIASLPPERRLFHRRNRRKKASFPQRSSLSKIQAIAAAPGQTNPVGEPLAPRPKPALWARRLRAAPLKTTNAMSAAFRRPGLSSPSRCAPSEAGAFWRCLVSRPCLPSDPYFVAAGQTGRRNAACSALNPGAALIVAFTQQSEQPLKKAWHSSNCSKMHNNGIISSPICQNTPVNPKFCDLTAQGASGF